MFQGDRVLVVCFNIFQHLFKLHDLFIIPEGLGRFLKITAAGEYSAKKLVESAKYLQLIASGMLYKGIKNTVDSCPHTLVLPAEMMIDLCPVVDDFLDIGLAGPVLF